MTKLNNRIVDVLNLNKESNKVAEKHTHRCRTRLPPVSLVLMLSRLAFQKDPNLPFLKNLLSIIYLFMLFVVTVKTNLIQFIYINKFNLILHADLKELDIALLCDGGKEVEEGTITLILK